VARKPLPEAAMKHPSAGPDEGRRTRRFLLGALIAAALAALISGCVVFKSITPSQLNYVGKVQITSIICASDKDTSGQSGFNPSDTSCQGSTHGGNQNTDPTDNQPFQLEIGYRIPSTVTAPASFTSTNTSSPPTTPCGGSVVFSQSASYTSQLSANSAPGAGKQWVGYISPTQTYTNAGCQYTTVSPQFTLNQTSNQPFQGPFNYRVVVGFRTVNESAPGNTSARTVVCANPITDLINDGTDGADSDTTPDQSGVCADDPSGATISGTDLSQATHDLGVIPTNTSVNAGATANVPFNLKWAGTASTASFNVGASTTVPGATATPSITTLTPGADSNNNMTAGVSVPAGTTPGTYNVTVTATGTGVAAGQTRSGTATLTVGALIFNPAPTLPSLGTITLNGQSQIKNAQMNNFGVNDTTTNPSGWNVTAAGDGTASNSAVFKQYCNSGSACNGGSHPANSYVSGGFTLPANSLTLNSTSASFTGGTGSAPTFQCGGGSCAIDSATPTKIASAANGSAGTGLWSTTGFTSSSARLSTASTLRALPASEIYRVNVVWSLNSGP
jgi:hypothetical protein